MNCCNNNKYQKSALKTYNNSAQTVTEELTALQLVGDVCTDTGCSIAANPSSFQINKSGLYYMAADITFTPTAAGVSVIQLYKDNIPLPCAITQDSSEAGNISTNHFETVLQVATCDAIKPKFAVKTSGAAGDVNFVGVTVIKMA